MYWWLTTTSVGGRFVVLGPYDSEGSATEYGWSHLGSDFEVEQLSTRDMNKATRMLKKKRLDTSRDLEASLQRAKHKLNEKETS